VRTIAHFPSVKTLEDFDFKFQPSVDQKLVRELATGRFMATAENVLLFGPPGVGKSHLAVALGRAAVEAGHSVLFVTATTLIAALAKAQTEGKLAVGVSRFSSTRKGTPLSQISAIHNIWLYLVGRRGCGVCGTSFGAPPSGAHLLRGTCTSFGPRTDR
jgi:hypothetical protein